jgi:hypothetical protein
MGYCKRHDAYNGNGVCEHCKAEFEALPCRLVVPHPGWKTSGYWECLRDTIEKQKMCRLYSGGVDGLCLNLEKDECLLTRQGGKT